MDIKAWNVLYIWYYRAVIGLCMAKDIEKWCHECGRCILAKAIQPNVRLFMGSIQASCQHEVVAIDFTVLEPALDGRENVLVLTDVFSKYTQAIPTKDQRASTVAEVLVKHWFNLFGPPIGYNQIRD